MIAARLEKAGTGYTGWFAGLATVPPEGDFFIFFNDTAAPEIYTLPLHDALPLLSQCAGGVKPARLFTDHERPHHAAGGRSEEHTSELQSRSDLVCRLLLEKN